MAFLSTLTYIHFFASISYPAVTEIGLRLRKMGRTIITYELALFERGVEEVKAVCEMVQVIIERETGRPARDGINGALRRGLQPLLGEASVDGKKVIPKL